MKNLTFSKFRNFIAFALFLSISGGIFAQTNFSGNWVVNQSKSKFGEAPGGPGGGPGGPGPMGGGPMIVSQDAKLLTVTQTMQGPDGEMKMVNKYNLDGTPSENSFMMDMTRKSTLSWSADKKSVTIVSTMDFNGNEMKETETWKLSADGSTLFIDSTRPAGPDGGEMKMMVAYDKK
jgi:hypothetical protein